MRNLTGCLVGLKTHSTRVPRPAAEVETHNLVQFVASTWPRCLALFKPLGRAGDPRDLRAKRRLCVSCCSRRSCRTSAKRARARRTWACSSRVGASSSSRSASVWCWRRSPGCCCGRAGRAGRRTSPPPSCSPPRRSADTTPPLPLQDPGDPGGLTVGSVPHRMVFKLRQLCSTTNENGVI